MAPPETEGEQALLSASPGALVAADERGHIAFLNSDAERLLGWSLDEATGQALTILMPERMRKRHKEGLARYQATHESQLMGRPVRVPAQRKDGREIEIELTLRMFKRPDGSQLIVAHMRETTSAKPAGPEVIELETRLARRLYQLI